MSDLPSDDSTSNQPPNKAARDAAKNAFLAPRSKYYGEFSPGSLTFNSNLQEFAHRVSLICGLETGGKLPPGEAYEQIKLLWKELKQSKKNLLSTPLNPADEEPQGD